MRGVAKAFEADARMRMGRGVCCADPPGCVTRCANPKAVALDPAKGLEVAATHLVTFSPHNGQPECSYTYCAGCAEVFRTHALPFGVRSVTALDQWREQLDRLSLLVDSFPRCQALSSDGSRCVRHSTHVDLLGHVFDPWEALR